MFRAAVEDDLEVLKRDVKAAVDRSFELELADQADDVHSIFIALDAQGAVLGSGFIHWRGPRDPAALALFPDAPEIFRVEVRQAHRSRGIGGRLIQAMEACVRVRGYRQVGLGVAHANPDAYRLYRKLGYLDTQLSEYYDEYQYPVAGGGYATARDLCRYLAKSLVK